MSYIWTSGDRRVPALTPFTDETAGFLPMSFKHFIPLWPRVILTTVLILGLVSGLLAWKAFNDVGANTWQQSEKYDSDSSSSSSSSGGSSSRRRRKRRRARAREAEKEMSDG